MSLPRFRTRATHGQRVSARSERDGARVHVVTFGCQMNKYDSLLAEGRFVRAGYSLVDDPAEADVLLFNTCSVRDHAEERVWSWLGELKRRKASEPDLVIGVMGCMAQRIGEEVFDRAGHVDLVCGTRRFPDLPALVEEVRGRRARLGGGSAEPEAHVLDVATDAAVRVDREGEAYTGGLHGYLAVMRGCDLHCAFCVVPATRGRAQSRPIPELVREARWMVEQGCRAITLLGQTIDGYGEDLPAPGPGEPRGSGRRGRPALADLIRALQEVGGLARLRLVTLHPAYVTRALAEAIRDCDKVDRFLPLPAQSGSDRVLKAMKRGYTTDLYRRRVELLREAVPDLELGSDWIVGFPTETDREHEASEDFLGEIGFAQSYVFQYSPRPDTAAFERADDVPRAVKKERNRRLLAVAERSALRRMERRLERELDVFVEGRSPRDGTRLVGRSTQGLPVSFPAGPEDADAAVGATVRVRALSASPYGLAGEPLARSAGRGHAAAG